MATVVGHYINANEQDLIKDINLVYQEKFSLYYQALLFADRHCPAGEVTLQGTSEQNYTGNGDLLHSLNLDLQGLKQGIEDYKPNE
jgi:hypothetical protein